MWPAVLVVAACALLAGPASAAAAPPTIESEWVTGVTEHNAVLHATINPNGTLTQYKLQFDESGTYHFYHPDCGVLHVPGLAYCQHVTPGDERIEPPEGSIPAGGDAVEVSVDLASIGATIEPNTTYHYRAIAANGAPEVEGPDQTFTTPPVGSAPPTIESESVTAITETEATLEAQINPNGLDTTYQFRLESGCLPPLLCMAITIYPLPAGSIPASFEAQSVSLDLNDAGVTLHPGTKYRYSVEATNSAGPTVKGPDQTFTTPSPPSIESESVSNVSSTDATLEAQINPSGFETAYELQIDTTGNFKFFQTSGCPLNVPEMGCTTEVRSGDPLAPGLVQPPEYILAASDAPQHVSVNMAAIGATLQPGTTYHYRAIAANRTGYAYGPDQTFTTPSSDFSDSPNTTPPGQPLGSSAGQPSLPAVNPAPSASHPRRAKHKRHGHRRHSGSARSTRTARH